MKGTQCERVLKYMKENGEIDSLTALRELGCMRLASRINDLKRRGYAIKKRWETGKNRYDEKVTWAVYFMDKQGEKEKCTL